MSVLRLQARVPEAQILAPVRLPGHRLAFHKIGSDGSGKCDIPEAIGDEVHGVLYRLPRAALAVLDRYEGVGCGYERIEVRVELTDRSLLAASYRATSIDTGLRPFCWYRHHVSVGAEAARLPRDYVDRIRSLAVVSDRDDRRRRREMAIYSRGDGA